MSVTLVTRLSARIAAFFLLFLSAAFSATHLQAQVSSQSSAAPAYSATAALYRQLREAGLEQSKTFRVRDASFDREDLHFSLSEGWLVLGQEISGHVTSAVFVGEGEVLMIAPDRRERASLALFTGSAVLEEQFTSAYFRFFDDKLLADIVPGLRPDTNPETAENNGAAAKQLAQIDALRILLGYVNSYGGTTAGAEYLHARVNGRTHGNFDIFYDQSAPEQIALGQVGFAPGGAIFYNVWAAFMSRSHRDHGDSEAELPPMRVGHFDIKANVRPPDSLEGEAELDMNVLHPGTRAVLFELSRNLRLSSVTMDGAPLEFLQNEAIEGSRVSRDGNDVVAVVLPHFPRTGDRFKLRFAYSGSVLSDAGGGLLYVGARGNWYPNLGLQMADFDLRFTAPADWTLIATGKQIDSEAKDGQQISRWRSERPIPVAGFNLGHYRQSTIRAGNVLVQSFAAAGVERSFPLATHSVVEPSANPRRPGELEATRVPVQPKPAGEMVANEAASAIEYIGAQIGEYPYSTLGLTQIPGTISQGWPGLVFLSSYVFVPPAERPTTLHADFARVLFDHLMVRHETAHQWWGDSVYWTTYRDQWLSEALANYSAMLSFESEHPEDVQTVLKYYRTQLAEKSPQKKPNAEAGPVTLGQRLNSSQFPNGYDLITYGRGTWLVHMLRELLRDPNASGPRADRVFLSALRGLQHDLSGKQMSTLDFQRAFERVLPKSLYYENKPSLDWFFDGWVNGTAQPRYEIKSGHAEHRASDVRISGKLLQKDAPGELITAVPIYAELGKGELRFVARIFADGPETSFTLKVPPGTKRLIADPYGTILTAP
jgi:hypothetical protein